MSISFSVGDIVKFVPKSIPIEIYGVIVEIEGDAGLVYYFKLRRKYLVALKVLSKC